MDIDIPIDIDIEIYVDTEIDIDIDIDLHRHRYRDRYNDIAINLSIHVGYPMIFFKKSIHVLNHPEMERNGARLQLGHLQLVALEQRGGLPGGQAMGP